MRERFFAFAITLVFCVALFSLFTKTIAAQKMLPNPVLVFAGQEPYSTPSGQFIRYKYFVFNSDVYPANLFAAAPSLPPCGRNTNSSRTWVDLFDSRGKRLYGFCALGSPNDLNSIWFGLPESEIPPSYIYIEMNDRQENKKYKSNLADTVL